jgi:hypothetical protein
MKETQNRTQAIIIRPPESIYQAHGEIEKGTFDGRWHFAFDEYYDRDYSHFGTLRVFNDDTLSPGATWPLHPHRNIEVVTYCAGGEFRHADQDGKGGILRPGWVQHTTVGRGMWHSEINNSEVEPMRFIQIWFLPAATDLEPSVERKEVERAERTNVLLPLVSAEDTGALPIAADGSVYSSFLEAGHQITCDLGVGRGCYLYVLEGGPVSVDGHNLPALAAAKVVGGMQVTVEAQADAELLVVKVPLTAGNSR